MRLMSYAHMVGARKYLRAMTSYTIATHSGSSSQQTMRPIQWLNASMRVIAAAIHRGMSSGILPGAPRRSAINSSAISRSAGFISSGMGIKFAFGQTLSQKILANSIQKSMRSFVFFPRIFGGGETLEIIVRA